MATMLWIFSFCSFLFIHILLTAEGSELRDNFYNELRSLLNNKEIFPEASIPRPREVKGWGAGLETILGEVSGVSVNPLGQPVIFHRGPRSWTPDVFNITNHFQYIHEGPIKVNTVVVLNEENGEVLNSWGAEMFYLPHGLTVDHHGNTWVTDVAMHQVMKFPAGWRRPSLRLGELFSPGHGTTQFCKPTSVAVATTGEFFVADGYCNRRILKYSHQGKLERIFPHRDEFLSLVVPHSIALLEHKDLLCVADREDMRVVCFKAELGQPTKYFKDRFTPLTIHQPDFGRIYAIAFKDDLVYAVNGPTSSHIPLQGFTIDPFTESVIDHWGPRKNNGFTNPHAMAVSPMGDAMYVTETGPFKVWKFIFN